MTGLVVGSGEHEAGKRGRLRLRRSGTGSLVATTGPVVGSGEKKPASEAACGYGGSRP